MSATEEPRWRRDSDTWGPRLPDGKQVHGTCGKRTWRVTHSCSGVPSTDEALERYKVWVRDVYDPWRNRMPDDTRTPGEKARLDGLMEIMNGKADNLVALSAELYALTPEMSAPQRLKTLYHILQEVQERENVDLLALIAGLLLRVADPVRKHLEEFEAAYVAEAEAGFDPDKLIPRPNRDSE